MHSHDAPFLLFATPRYRRLGDDMLDLGSLDRGELDVRTFPDGECYQRLVTPVAGRRVALLGGTVDDAEAIRLYDLACAVAEGGALALSLVVPYYGYSTMERATKPGEVVAAKSRARLLSSVPLAHHGNEVLLVDLHTGGLPHYFEGPITPVHLTARAIVLRAARRLAHDDRFVLGSVDTGRAKQVESLAISLGAGVAFVFKRRVDGDTTRVAAVSAAVDGQTVLIYDDMIRTGGSLIGAARAYRDAGARRIAAIATHGVLPGDALERLRACEVFDEIVVTDSHPRARELEDAHTGFLTVESVAPLLHRALVHRERG